MKCFWMVLGSGVPVHRHSSEALARAEAERLARIQPGQVFVVLKSIGQCVRTEVRWDVHDEEPDGDICF